MFVLLHSILTKFSEFTWNRWDLCGSRKERPIVCARVCACSFYCCFIITHGSKQFFVLFLLDNKAIRLHHTLVWSFVHSRTQYTIDTLIYHHTSWNNNTYLCEFVGRISSFVSFCHVTASDGGGGKILIAKFKCTHSSSGIDFVLFPLRNVSMWHEKHSKKERAEVAAAWKLTNSIISQNYKALCHSICLVWQKVDYFSIFFFSDKIQKKIHLISFFFFLSNEWWTFLFSIRKFCYKTKIISMMMMICFGMCCSFSI